MSSSRVGRSEPDFRSCSPNPSADRSLVTLEKPSSPLRLFSSASSVARLIEALRANSAWVRPSFLRLAAICAPKEGKVSMRLIY